MEKQEFYLKPRNGEEDYGSTVVEVKVLRGEDAEQDVRIDRKNQGLQNS